MLYILKWDLLEKLRCARNNPVRLILRVNQYGRSVSGKS